MPSAHSFSYRRRKKKGEKKKKKGKKRKREKVIERKIILINAAVLLTYSVIRACRRQHRICLSDGILLHGLISRDCFAIRVGPCNGILLHWLFGCDKVFNANADPQQCGFYDFGGSLPQCCWVRILRARFDLHRKSIS